MDKREIDWNIERWIKNIDKQKERLIEIQKDGQKKRQINRRIDRLIEAGGERAENSSASKVLMKFGFKKI